MELGSQTFHTYKTDPADQQSLPANGVMSLFEDTHGNLWVGTYGGGLARFDRARDSFRRYASTAAEKGLSSDPAAALAEDQTGKPCGGTHGGGLNLRHPDTGKD